MPKIDENILDFVIYLYDSEMDAEEGSASGGSGFLLLSRLRQDRRRTA